MKRHPFDVFSFVAGALFLLLAVGFAADGLDRWNLDVAWVPAVTLIALGLGGAASSLLRRSAQPPQR